jgi:hypothetical protein
MFRPLLAHPQESLHKRHLVYCVRVMSVGCYQGWSGQPTDIKRAQYTKSVCWAPPENEQVMLETRRGPQFLINWIKSASRLFHYTDILWYTVNKILSFWNTYRYHLQGSRTPGAWISWPLYAGYRAGLWVWRAGPLPRPLTSRGRRKGSHRLVTR